MSKRSTSAYTLKKAVNKVRKAAQAAASKINKTTLKAIVQGPKFVLKPILKSRIGGKSHRRKSHRRHRRKSHRRR